MGAGNTSVLLINLVRNLGLIWYETFQSALVIALKIRVMGGWWCPGEAIYYYILLLKNKVLS